MKGLQQGINSSRIVTEDGRVICPRCGRPTQQRVRPDTTARNWPVWCKHCKQESIVNIDESLSQCRTTTSA
ncbi:cysteine-rich KTR domain-containing protein [Lawsonibacter faecis]|uniref:cysteine-rich KTR domain-containing protein n=1 Tax=Lawsonibacter faecis TaxID=2763052 RepID=UPI003C6DA7DF